MALERLQKILARAGVSSRRHAEQLVLAGRVRVNGQVVTELGSRADPFVDKVEVDGHRAIAEAPVYVIMHKPRATVSTASDPEGRPTVTSLVSGIRARLYPVGRLDFQTSGALLLTNDGEFAAGMLHPSRKVPKVYLVKLEGEVTEQDVQKWRDGVVLDDGVKTQRAEARVVRVEDGRSWLEVELHEGRNQQIRRMGVATGFEVLRLTRLSFAGIDIEGLRPGGWRLLTSDELKKLRDQFGVPRRVKPAVSDENELPDQHPSRRMEARRGGAAPARGRPAAERPARRVGQEAREFDREAPPRTFDRKGPPRDEARKPFQKRDADAPRDFDRKGPPGKRPFRKDDDAPRTFDRKGPPRDEARKPFQKRDADAPRDFDRKGPPGKRPFRKDDDAPRTFDRKGPPREDARKPFQKRDADAPRDFDRKGPPGKKPFRKDDDAPRTFDRKGPPRDDRKKPFQKRDADAPRDFDRKGPPGKRPFRKDDDAPRTFDRKGPPRDDRKKPFRKDDDAPRTFDRKGPPRDAAKKPFDRKGPPRDKKPHGKPAKGKTRGGKPVAKRRSQNRKKEE